MIPGFVFRFPGFQSIPRESGDDPLSLEEQEARREYSPREWG